MRSRLCRIFLRKFICFRYFSMTMATYLLGEWAPSLFELEKVPFKPVGVVVREGDDVAARVVDPSLLPEEYKPRGEIEKQIWDQIETSFRATKGYSTYATNFYFSEYKFDFPGSLEEKADVLYEQFVAPGFKQQA
jgi:hypothetical protein